MDLNNIQTFMLLQEKMKYHSKRQAAIAENFANANTPGYLRKEVEKPDFGAMVGQASKNMEMKVTDPNHINSSNIDNDGFMSTDVKVKLDLEAVQMTQNNGEFSKSAATYKKMLTLMREAIGNSQ